MVSINRLLKNQANFVYWHTVISIIKERFFSFSSLSLISANVLNNIETVFGDCNHPSADTDPEMMSL